MNSELFEALEVLEKEKNISKDTLLDAIKQSLLQACKNHYGRNEANNVVVNIDPKTCEFEIYAEKRVVDVVEDDLAGDQPGRCTHEGSKIRARRYRARGYQVQGVWTYRDAECEECHPSEDP